MRRFHFPQLRWFPVLLWGAVLLQGGCASSVGPDVVAVESGRYSEAFDAAVEAARRDGLQPVLRDRRAGVIETDTRTAGSVLEPWRIDNASFAQGLENTVGLQRRRARFEVVPAGFSPTVTEAHDESANASDPLMAHDIDLSVNGGQLELRVWVYIERANAPGVRRGTWTRHSTTTTTTDLESRAGDGARSARENSTVWHTVARDTAYERRLLERVQNLLAQD